MNSTKVKIGHVAYKVTVVSALEETRLQVGEGYLRSTTCESAREILIDARISKTEQQSALLREILGILDRIGILRMSKKELDSLGFLLSMVFSDNPGLLQRGGK